MISNRLSLQEIYQYLSQKNFNLTSDRILKDPQANSDTIWSILSFLAGEIKDNKYEQIEPSLFYLLNSENHKNSLKKIKEYITVSSVLHKLGFEIDYPFRQIIRPDKEPLLEKISSLIQANKFCSKTLENFRPYAVEQKTLKNSLKEARQKYEQIKLEIEETKSAKESERQQYEYKISSIENLSKELAYKKKERLNLLNSQQQLNNELTKKVKSNNELTYLNDDYAIRIKRLEREVIQNAPKLKKDRLQLIEKYEGILKKSAEEAKLWDKKFRLLDGKLKQYKDLENVSSTFKIEEILSDTKSIKEKKKMVEDSLMTNEVNKGKSTLTKKNLMQKIQSQEKLLKQIKQFIKDKETVVNNLSRNNKKMQQEVKKHHEAVRMLEDKNQLSIGQYAKLDDKIKHRRDKVRQRIFEFNLRLSEMSEQSKSIIEQAFADFN